MVTESPKAVVENCRLPFGVLTLARCLKVELTEGYDPSEGHPT